MLPLLKDPNITTNLYSKEMIFKQNIRLLFKYKSFELSRNLSKFDVYLINEAFKEQLTALRFIQDKIRDFENLSFPFFN